MAPLKAPAALVDIGLPWTLPGCLAPETKEHFYQFVLDLNSFNDAILLNPMLFDFSYPFVTIIHEAHGQKSDVTFLNTYIVNCNVKHLLFFLFL